MFETVANPMTWYPDLSEGVTVTIPGSWSGAGTKVELCAAAPFDLLITSFLAIPTAVGSTTPAQFQLWTDPTGSTLLGTCATSENGITGDGFGPATIELAVPLFVASGTRIMVSGARGIAGNATWFFSIGIIPSAVTGSITSTSAVLKTAPLLANGTSITPADLDGTYGNWVQILAAATGNLIIQYFIVKYPNQMSKSKFKIGVGIGAPAAEAQVDEYAGGSGDTAIATEGLPLVLYGGVLGSGFIAAADRVSIRLSAYNHNAGANLNAWTVHMVYFEL